MTDQEWSALKVLAITLISFAGGSLGYVMRSIDRGVKVTFARTIMEGLSAAFFGAIVGVAYTDFNISWTVAFAASGLVAWGGARLFLKVAEIWLKKKFGLDISIGESRNDETDRK